MTPIEWAIATVAIVWVLKNAAVDTAFAVRGKTSPRLEARLAAARAGRYGARQYVADAMSDFWRGARERREARLEGRTPPPRPRGRIGTAIAGLRGRVTGWWDRATTTVDNRRQAERLADQDRLYHSRWQRLRDRLLGQNSGAWPEPRPRPAEDFAGRPTTRDQTANDTETRPTQPGPEPSGDTQSGPATTPTPDGSTTGPQPPPPPKPAPQQGQDAHHNPRRKYVTQPANMPSGETTGVISGAQQAQQLRLTVTNLRESTLASISMLIQRIDQMEAAAAELRMDAQTMAQLAQAREALTSLKSAITSTADEVDGAMAGVESAWQKHLPGVEFNQSVGGVADRRAYEN